MSSPVWPERRATALAVVPEMSIPVPLLSVAKPPLVCDHPFKGIAYAVEFAHERANRIEATVQPARREEKHPS
jgi:hypothetical protein